MTRPVHHVTSVRKRNRLLPALEALQARVVALLEQEPRTLAELATRLDSTPSQMRTIMLRLQREQRVKGTRDAHPQGWKTPYRWALVEPVKGHS